ncbi:DUF11 domain-containing protein, partial [Candidatus Dojkabacteria bacterium]|nr:DUF11 domain-containing protein [Candidatus Dojkabacteria bacterium]
MALRLNKTSKILFALGIVILSGALGYLIWRVNEKETTAPEDSEAGSNQCNCCPEGYHSQNMDLISDWEEGCIVCNCTYTPNVCEGREGATVPTCGGTECSQGSHCDPCTWPQVAFCISGECVCEDHGFNTTVRCNDTSPTCSLDCPSGYSEYFTNSSCGSGEIAKSCEASCAGCNNPYIAKGCCKPDSQPVLCGNGTKDSGEACDPKASPTGCNTGSTCLSNCTCSASTCGNGKLNTGEECESGNPSGTSCTWDNCNQTSCKCRQLTITKSVTKSCLNTDTDSPIAELTYTITMKNDDTDNRTITKVKDVLDSKILAGSIVPSGITTPGTYSDGKIVWKYDTENLVIKGGESKVLTYKVNIDKSHFGTYKNTVTMTRSTGVTSEAKATIIADCDIATPLATCGNGALDAGESCELNNPQGTSCTWDNCNKTLCVCVTPTEPEPVVPQTGIFDSTLGRIGAGI